MSTRLLFNRMGYVLSLMTFLFGFILFYSDSKDWMGSLVAAVLSAALVLASFIILGWLAQVFTK